MEAVAVDGPGDLVPDHVLAALLLGQGQRTGARAGLPPGGWPAADTEAGRVRAVLLLPVLEAQHSLGPAEAPGGDRVVEHHHQQDQEGGVGHPEVNHSPPSPPSPATFLPDLLPALASLLSPDRLGVAAGNVQVVVRLPPGVVRSQVNLRQGNSNSQQSGNLSTFTHLYASLLELIEVFLGRVRVSLRVGSGGDGDPGEPDQVAAN